MGNFPGLVDLSSYDQRVAVWHSPCDRADHPSLTPRRFRSNDRDALDEIIHLKFGRKLFEVARYPAAVHAKQSAILNAARILTEMLIDCIQLACARQACDKVQLTGDHPVGSC